MRKIKKHIYIIILSIIVYFILMAINNKIIIKSDYDLGYIVIQDIKRGEIIDKNKISVIKISKGGKNNSISFCNSPIDKVSNCDLNSGQILLEDMVVDKNYYVMPSQDMELVSIKLASTEDESSYQIKKDSIVNIYYTSKTSQIVGLLNNRDFESISTNGIDGYSTIKLLENIKIVDVYNKNRRELE